MDSQGEYRLDTSTEAGIRMSKEEKAALSEIITVINNRFGTEFTAADKLLFDQIEEDMIADEKLSAQAKSNSIDNFKFGFKEAAIDKFINRMDQNEDIFTRMMDNDDFSGLVMDYLMKRVYGRLNK